MLHLLLCLYVDAAALLLLVVWMDGGGPPPHAGVRDRDDVWHEEGKKKLKKNTFLDYVACANHLIEQRYTYKGGICFYGGSAGGLTGGAVANMAPDLFFSMLLLVPFVDTMTTMLNEKLKSFLNIFFPTHPIIILKKKIILQC